MKAATSTNHVCGSRFFGEIEVSRSYLRRITWLHRDSWPISRQAGDS